MELCVSGNALTELRSASSSLRVRLVRACPLKTAQVNLRIRPELKTAAEKATTDDHRSLTSLIEKLLFEYLKKRGYLPKE
jgi:hypothetical protein